MAGNVGVTLKAVTIVVARFVLNLAVEDLVFEAILFLPGWLSEAGTKLLGGGLNVLK